MEDEQTKAVINSLQGIPVLSSQETVNSMGIPKKDWKSYRENAELGDLGKLTEGWWSNNWQTPDAIYPEKRVQEEAENK